MCLGSLVGSGDVRDVTSVFPAVEWSDGSDWLPLTAYQHRIWNADKLAQDASYHISMCWRINGALDVSALGAAWMALQQKHEVLRVRIDERVSGVMQRVVSPSFAAGLARLHHVEARHAQLDEIIAEEVRRRFSLNVEPPIRACLLDLAGGGQVLLVTVHHVVADGWTVGLLAKDFARCYAAEQTKPDDVYASPGGLSLSALVAEECRRSARRLRASEYWQGILTEAAPLRLPVDRPDGAAHTSAGDSVIFEIPSQICSALTNYAASRSSSVFTVLVSVLQAFLLRITGQRDICIGYPVARRSGSARARTAGCLINTLVLPAVLDPTDTLDLLVTRNRERLRQARNHEDVLLESLRDVKESSRHFDVLFNFNKFDQPELNLPGLAIETLPRRSYSSPYALAWIVSDIGTTIRGRLEFQTDRFEQATVQRLLDHWLTLLHSSLLSPAQPICTLDLIRPEQVLDLLALGSVDDVTSGAPELPHRLVELCAQRTPNATALVCGDRVLSYGELNASANAVASRLLAMGAGPEEPIAVCVSRGPEQAVCLLAVLKSGSMYLPLDPLAPDRHVSRVLNDASVRYVLTDVANASRFTGYATCLVDSKCDYEGLDRTRNAAPTIAPDSAAYCLYTSGSTGRPKGVVVPHLALAHHIRAASAAYSVRSSDTLLQFASTAFDTSLEQTLLALTAGAKLVIRGDAIWSVDELVSHIRDHEITIADIPAAYWYLLSRTNDERYATLGLRLLIVGGEAVLATSGSSVALAKRLLNAYGPTEATITCTLGALEDTYGCRGPYIAIGRPLPGTCIRILDERLQLVPIGVQGEVFIAGDRVARGYLGDSALTAERFLQDPFGRLGARMYRTGDFGRWLAGGRIEFLGRRDQQVKVRGVRIELGQIEAVLLTHSAVRNAAVYVGGNADDSELVACVVLDSGRDALEGVRRHVRLELPDGMQPTRWLLMDSLPLTSQGKIDRSKLPNVNSVADIGAGCTVPISASGQETLTELLRALSELAPAPVQDIDASLHDVGINSVVMIRLLAECQRRFGVTLKPRELLKAGTVRRIAERIDVARLR